MPTPKGKDEHAYLNGWTAVIEALLRCGALLALASAAIGISWQVMWFGQPANAANLIFGVVAILGAVSVSLLCYIYLFHSLSRFLREEAQRGMSRVVQLCISMVASAAYVSLQYVLIEYMLQIYLPSVG